MKRIVLLMAFALAATAGAVDATLTWKGPASGGSWDDPANWSTTSTDKTVEEYMTTGVCTYQFSGLADGAVVTNRLAGRKVGGLSIPALKNGRLTFAGAKCALFGPLSWYIGEGTTVDWQIPHPNEWNNNDNGEKICIVGTGTLYLNPQGDGFAFYKRRFEVCTGATVVFANSKVNFSLTFLILYDKTSSVRLETDLTVANLNCSTGHAGCIVDLNGHNLYVGSGEPSITVGVDQQFAGVVTGEGNLYYYGGQEAIFYTIPTFTGDWHLLTYKLSFPNTFSMPSTIHPWADGVAPFRFASPQTLNGLSGDAGTGGVLMGAGATSLTLTGDAGRKSTFQGRIRGTTDVTKTGADYELVMCGDNAWTGTTHIAEGTLTVKRPVYRSGLVAKWTFDDPDNLGRDYGPNAHDMSIINMGTNGAHIDPTQRVDGVGMRGAAQFRINSDETAMSLMRASNVTRANGFPTGSHPVSCSFWFRPDKTGQTNGSNTYLFRYGAWGIVGGQMAMFYCPQSNPASDSLKLFILNWPATSGESTMHVTCPNLRDGAWHHIVASWEAGTLNLWLDGVLAGTIAQTKDTLAIPATTTLEIGSSDSRNIHTTRVLGGVDDFCVWDHALTTEEVAAEYAETRPAVQNLAARMPQPVCHWAFNDVENPGKDSMGHADLLANPNYATVPSVQTYRTGAYGCHLHESASMTLPVADFPENFPTGKSPFTVSIRLNGYPTQWRSILYWGNLTNDVRAFNLYNDNCPRQPYVSCGALSIPNGRQQASQWTSSFHYVEDAWSHFVVVGDNATGTLKMYRDGRLERSFTGFTYDIEPGDFFLNCDKNGWHGTGVAGYCIDDVQIFDKALSAYEVMTLARSLERGSVGPILPKESAVTVDDGARLQVETDDQTLASLAGAGEVFLAGSAWLGIDDAHAFTGAVTGLGMLAISNTVKGATISANVELASELTVGNAADDLPLATTTRSVTVPSSGRVVFTTHPRGGTYVLARGAEIRAPNGVAGWTSNIDNLGSPVVFSVADGVFSVKIRGGMVITVR